MWGRSPPCRSRAHPCPASIADPRTNSIYYGLDTDTGKTLWFSLDLQEDDWTAHYLDANPRRAALPQYVPFMQWQYLTHEAPAVALPAPLIERLDGRPICCTCA